jgi:hypothetical protein
VSRRLPKRATKAEEAYIRKMEEASAFDLVDRGKGEVLRSEDYPEPLRRFLARERRTVHIKLSTSMKRKLEAQSRETGRPVEDIARHLIEQGIDRDAG